MAVLWLVAVPSVLIVLLWAAELVLAAAETFAGRRGPGDGSLSAG